MTLTRNTLLISALCFSLGACQGANTKSVESAPEIFRVDETPHAQLSGNVIPQAYRLDMRMNPDDEGFSGVVEIDVDIQTPTDKIWLHGKEMSVSSAIAMTGDKETILSFTELPIADAPSGISYLTSESVLPAGPTTLKLVYATPYNQALNSAYQVKRNGEGYIVTQFEPLGAREAFPSFDEPKYKVPFTLSITAPADDFVYANTPETQATTLEDGWIKHCLLYTSPSPRDRTRSRMPSSA